MATSETAIKNLAISHLGTAKEISSSTDRSAEAYACNRYFDTCREETLRALDWTFARKEIALGLVAENPTPEWGHSYQYPSDCLMIRKIRSGIRNDNHQSRVRYIVVRGASSKLIYTDQKDAVCRYTVNEKVVSLYPSDFVMAMSLKLSMMIAPRLTSGDPFNIISRLNEQHKQYMQMAMVNNFNEEQLDEIPDSEFIRTRG